MTKAIKLPSSSNAARNGTSAPRTRPQPARKVARMADAELFAVARTELFVAVVGDVMDHMGLRNQFLSPQIRPLRSDMVLIGRAMPVLGVSVFDIRYPDSNNPIMAKEFGLMFDAVDDLKQDEVYVCTGSRPVHALWGELLGTRAAQLGAAGAVCDGYSRDSNGLLAMNFPTFSFGPYAQDSGPRYKVMDYRIGIDIGGVKINDGDVLYGDIDGVCVVPKAAVDEVFHAALEKARGEKRVRAAILKGMSAREAWDTFGIM